ncbi:hypothetical protein [Streptomyces bauhiniae]
MTDDEAVAAITNRTFEWRDGQPVLPVRKDPLGRWLHNRMVSSDDRLETALPAEVKAALEAKEFRVVEVEGQYGLAKDTLRAGSRALSDNQLAQQIAAYEFTRRDGHPVLPPKAHPLGRRLQHSTVADDDSLNTTLSAGAKAALEAKGFTVVPVESRVGARYGLHKDTLREGRPPALSDDQLAQQIAAYEFTRRDGHPVLPLQSDPLGRRLHNSTVAADGSLNTGLSAGAKAALEAKNFRVEKVEGSKGARYGLHKDTLRESGKRPPQQEALGQAQAVPLQAATAGPQAPQQAIAGGHRLENAPQNWGEQFAETVTHVNPDVPQQNTDHPSFGFPYEYDRKFFESVVEATVDEAERNGLMDDYVQQQIARTARTPVPFGQSPAWQAPLTQEQVNYAWQARTAHMMNPPGGGPSQGR